MSRTRRSSPVARQLEQVQRWLEEGRAREARDLLEPLVERHSDRQDVLTARLAAAHVLGETVTPLCRRLLDLFPEDERPRQLLILEQMDRGRFALALHELRQFRGQVHEKVQAAMADLQERLPGLLESLELPPGEEGLQLLVLLEQADAHREVGEFAAGDACVQQVLQTLPDHEMALLRRASLRWESGPLEEIEALVDGALARVPDSGPLGVQKFRLLLVRDQREEARALAERLAALDPQRPGVRVAQALAWLEIGEFARVEPLLEGAPEDALALLHQVAGVAAHRLGRLEAARRHWQEARRRRPDFAEPGRNLADLEKPPAHRGGPWLHGPATVVPVSVLNRLRDPQSPGMAGAVRVLLQNSNPDGRRLAVGFALASADPAVAQALAEYATSNMGPDDSRLASGMVCAQRGSLPVGRNRMWIAGRWEGVQLIRCTPRPGPRIDGPAKAVRLVQKSDQLSAQGRHTEAEALCREALALKPGDPQLTVEVASCLYMQRRLAEAEAMLAGVLALEPPVPAAWILAALLDLENNQRESARARLDRVAESPELAGGELCAYTQGRIELALHAGDREEARAWALLGHWADPRAGLADLVKPMP